MSDMYPITLVCWKCRKKLAVDVSMLPQFAFEVANIASKVGWKGVLDSDNGRALVFCSDACSEASKTKKGLYPKRQPK